MPASLRDIAWPDFFVVEYRDGRRERLRRSWEGVSFPASANRDEEPDYFLAWPLAQPTGGLASYGVRGIKHWRLCMLEDVERILGDSGAGPAADRTCVMSHQVTDDDWRLQGQERYLSGVTLFWRPWHQTRPDWDHDHCSFCWAKFMDREDVPDVLREGYTTDDEYHWVCAECARDFAARFKFIFVGGPAGT